ncbi:hypothetical protein ACJ73_05538 [Blastomyces percursus]|uniref:Protein kinase domain-containing protein n=1 Tax=Blastomyces percursus TaxID=1658174 RepID=A0A1J9Q4S1_9EURO|nr:hypothetical protein ACJ73_05538 [Blastomyces percursus]
MSNVIHTPAIKDRPYCSQQCLLALRDGSPFDPSCPNYQDHRKGHMKVEDFRSHIRKQLARDRGPDADCRPLYKAGSCGTLLKVRFSSHGYTLVAKAVESKDKDKLQHERKVYNQLRDLQGECIPVCLGVVKLEPKRPYYHEEKIHTHILLLSWAGESIEKAGTLSPANKRSTSCERVRVVDFELATIRRPLSDVSTNVARKRKVMSTCFSKELQHIETVFGIQDLK